MRPESNQHSLFEPPPQSLVIRLAVKQLKCSSKPKGAVIHDECAPARVIDRLFQHIKARGVGGEGWAPLLFSRSMSSCHPRGRPQQMSWSGRGWRGHGWGGGGGIEGDTPDRGLSREEPLALALLFRLPQRVHAGLS